jgi:hypothetical protein
MPDETQSFLLVAAKGQDQHERYPSEKEHGFRLQHL